MISSPSRPPHVALALPEAAGFTTTRTSISGCTSADRTDPIAEGGEPVGTHATVRIQAADLGQAQLTTRRIRSAEAEAGRDPYGLLVLLDLEFLIAPDARTARTELAESNHFGCSATVRYVGTPHGLAGLISDIRAASVADGVTLIPLATSVTAAELVSQQVLPLLVPQEFTD